MREQTIQSGLKKASKIIEKMKNTKSLDYTLENIKINNKLILEVNCFRDHNIKSPYYAEPYMYEIYAIKDGASIDCITISDIENIESEIMYLLNCYV